VVAGGFATVGKIAPAEKINASYLDRVLHLLLSAPDIVEAILDGCQSAVGTLAMLMRPFAVGWGRQRATGCSPHASAPERVRNA
jgi:hypothetical protein